MSRPLQVLSLGKASAVFADSSSAGQGDVRQRHLFYAQRLAARFPGSELRMVTLTHGRKGGWFEQASESLRLYGTRSLHRASFMFDLARRARAALEDGWRPDVITSQEAWEEGVVASRMARSLGSRDLPQLHFDIFSDSWASESRINPLKRTLARHVFQHANCVRVVSRPLKNLMVARWGVVAERIAVAPVGVGFSASKLSSEECKRKLLLDLVGRPVVLFVGRLCAQKNLELWLSVARRVLASKPQTRFVLVGAGELAAPLERMIQAMGIAHAVFLVGSRDYAELPDVYGAADVFLLTSHYEGFGRVVLEAMLAGLPVVSTRSQGPEDLVEEAVTGHLTPVQDEDLLAQRIAQLLADPARAREMGKAGRRIALERFSLPVLTDRIIDAWAGT
jgi:glycosyltransferase involved in cell wall biosynthesis